MINIGGDPNDSSYRYKMPRLMTKIEGRGNGIKTVIVNMVDVAKALRCDPAYTTKFFGIELGAQSKFDRQKERAVVNGAFDAHEMQKILSKFLTQYILCPKCELPELRMIVKADVSADCQACGWTGILGGTPKLSTYILKQKRVSRKDKKSSKKERQEQREREKLKGRRDRARREKTTEAAKGESGGGEKPQRKKKDGDEIVWSTPSSKQAQQARREEEFKSMGSIHVIQGVERGAEPKNEKRVNQSPESILKEMFEVGTSPKDLMSEVRRLELAREWVPVKKLQTVFDALFNYNEPKQMVQAIEKQKEFLGSFTADEEGASLFIGVFEEVVGYKQTKLLPRVPILLQKFYDEDVLDEDAILAWYESTADPWIVGPDIAVDIRKEAQPFIQWLQTAEEDESEEEDDD